MSDFEISSELLNIYLEDARGHLESLDHSLLALERDGLDPEVIAGLLGPLHTLKGNSGMLGLTEIKDYVHKLEDVLLGIRDERIAVSPSLFDQLFQGASALREAVEGVPEGKSRGLGSESLVLDGLLLSEKEAAPLALV